MDGNGSPFWLVLGQSQSAGWSATLPGGRSLGPSQLVDGYANGWYVPAGAVDRTDGDPPDVDPAAGGVGRHRRVGRRPGRRHPGRGVAGRPPPPAALAPGAASPGAAQPGGPAGSGPLPVSWAAVAGLAGSRPRPVPLVGGRPRVGRRRRRGEPAGDRPGGRAWRWRPPAGGGADVWRCGSRPWRPSPASGCTWSAEQIRYHYLPTIDWPADLSSANDLAWLGLALLGADVVAGRDARPLRPGVYAPRQERPTQKGPFVITSGSAAGGGQVGPGRRGGPVLGRPATTRLHPREAGAGCPAPAGRPARPADPDGGPVPALGGRFRGHAGRAGPSGGGPDPGSRQRGAAGPGRRACWAWWWPAGSCSASAWATRAASARGPGAGGRGRHRRLGSGPGARLARLGSAGSVLGHDRVRRRAGGGRSGVAGPPGQGRAATAPARRGGAGGGGRAAVRDRRPVREGGGDRSGRPRRGRRGGGRRWATAYPWVFVVATLAGMVRLPGGLAAATGVVDGSSRQRGRQRRVRSSAPRWCSASCSCPSAGGHCPGGWRSRRCSWRWWCWPARKNLASPRRGPDSP